MRDRVKVACSGAVGTIGRVIGAGWKGDRPVRITEVGCILLRGDNSNETEAT